MKRKLSDLPNLRLALVLGVASSISVCLLYPYLLVLIPSLAHVKIPLWALIPIQVVQSGVQLTLVAWIGLRVGASIGLDAPYLRRALAHEPSPPHHFATAALVGFGVGALVTGLDRWVFMPRQPEGIRALAHAIAPWKGLLASFTGGICEEIMTRLFFMTLIAWVLVRARLPRSAAMIAAATIAAAAFAAGHLPTARQLAPLTTAVVVRVMVLNTLCGLPFGILFWRRGLEHAMVAHFCADLVLHVVAA